MSRLSIHHRQNQGLSKRRTCHFPHAPVPWSTETLSKPHQKPSETHPHQSSKITNMKSSTRTNRSDWRRSWASWPAAWPIEPSQSPCASKASPIQHHAPSTDFHLYQTDKASTSFTTHQQPSIDTWHLQIVEKITQNRRRDTARRISRQSRT